MANDWMPPIDREPTAEEVARNLLVLTASLVRRADVADVDDGRRTLVRLPTPTVQAEAEALILGRVAEWWANGWQPAELQRQGRRGCRSAIGARLIALAIAADHLGRPATTLDERWREQVEGLGLPEVSSRSGWIARWVGAEQLDVAATVDAVLDALATLLDLHALEPLVPPPGASSAGRRVSGEPAGRPAPSGGAVDPVLQRVRNLLAKAESSTFEAEAATFTAKAHELMTRHAIDAAMLRSSGSARGGRGGTGGGGGGPVVVRIPVDAPYVDAKSLLLQVVADAGRCTAVQLPSLGMSTVIGLPVDVSAVESLFTSLLVQAQAALAAAAGRAPTGTPTRGRSYRAAFHWSYATRIGQRLREVEDAVMAQARAERGTAFLPVLRSQAAEVDAMVTARFGQLRRAPVRRRFDLAGWSGGRLAADNAALTAGELHGRE